MIVKTISSYVLDVDLKHLIINTHCKIQKPCLSLLKIAKAVLTMHRWPRVRTPGSHLPSQLSWSIYVHSFVPSFVLPFKQHNLGPILLNNLLLLRDFAECKHGCCETGACFSKGKEEFKVKVQLFNLQLVLLGQVWTLGEAQHYWLYSLFLPLHGSWLKFYFIVVLTQSTAFI